MGKHITFRAATAYLSISKEYVDIFSPEHLLEVLANADELISFNGRTYDSPVLEYLVGLDEAKPLWRKPHHDLYGWSGTSNLKNRMRASVSWFR